MACTASTASMEERTTHPPPRLRAAARLTQAARLLTTRNAVLSRCRIPSAADEQTPPPPTLLPLEAGVAPVRRGRSSETALTPTAVAAAIVALDVTPRCGGEAACAANAAPWVREQAPFADVSI